MTFTLTAIFEIRPTELAGKQGVWTGRVASEPAKAMLVDATLRTPHDYLLAGFPKQAIKIMQADRTWIGKQDDMQQTPLHVAAQCGLVGAVRGPLADGADVDARCYNAFTPLHLADDPEVVKLLVGHKADVNARGVSGTAIRMAAGNYAHLGQYPEYVPDCDRRRAVTKILLDAGAEYDLVSACCLDDLERVRTLTADKREARNPEAMRMAATYGRTAIVKLLLERGADPEDRAVRRPASLLFRPRPSRGAQAAARRRRRSEGPHRAPRQWRGASGVHPPPRSRRQGSCRIGKTARSARGVSVDARNAQGATPLDEACSGGHPEMVNWLLRNKADVNAHADRGRTPTSPRGTGNLARSG